MLSMQVEDGTRCAVANLPKPVFSIFARFGQLGIGSFASKAAPTAISTRRMFRSVVTGGDKFSGRTCGIAADEKSYCWGSNRHGQLGDGTTGHQFAAEASAVIALGDGFKWELRHRSHKYLNRW
jgi:Regulator of chromosome condensation (RCC1) repeat